MVDLIKSQLLPAWPFSSVTLRYQQHFLRKLLTERAGYADLRDEVACEPAASIREFRCGAVLGIPVENAHYFAPADHKILISVRC
jgi:hypothetical protein